MLAYLVMEIRRSLRNAPYILYTLVFPLGGYLMLTALFNPGSGNNLYAVHYMVSMALYAMMAIGITGVSAQIAFERRGGWTRLLSLSPLRPWSYLVIKIGAAILLTVPEIVLILLSGALINGVRLPLADWFGLVPVLWLGSLPFIAMGIAIGYSFRDEAANGVSIIVMFGLAIAGGLWIPTQIFPTWLANLSSLLPSYRGAELGWRLVDGLSPFSSGSLIFFGWLVVSLGLAGWRFRRAN